MIRTLVGTREESVSEDSLHRECKMGIKGKSNGVDVKFVSTGVKIYW